MCISEKEIHYEPAQNLDSICQLSACLLLRAPRNRLGHHPTDRHWYLTSFSLMLEIHRLPPTPSPSLRSSVVLQLSSMRLNPFHACTIYLCVHSPRPLKVSDRIKVWMGLDTPLIFPQRSKVPEVDVRNFLGIGPLSHEDLKCRALGWADSNRNRNAVTV